jgi:hypothetical protein
MGHVVLLGDSILDNASYVPGGSPVVEQLRSRLRDWRVTLLARDGAISSGVHRQLLQMPTDATHLVISAGGNDALQASPILNSPVADPRDMLAELVSAQNDFRDDYREMLRAVRASRLPTVGCTIYDAIPGLHPIERMALSIFNDTILRELFAAHMPVLDLRFVCNESRDYSSLSPIEPSEIGGAKIVRGLQKILLDHDFSRPETVVYT